VTRPLRFLPAGSLVEVTMRTLHGRLLLRPSPRANDLIVGVIGRAQSKYGMRIHALIFLSTHMHLLLSPESPQQLAAFMDYVLSGKARVGLGFPNGEWQRFDLAPGEIAILPQGWFHYIENVGAEMLQMLVIFNNSAPNDIGISVGFQTVPKEVLGLTFGLPAERFEGLDLDVRYIAPQ
jgi:REP element-mobilizing transposase RayT